MRRKGLWGLMALLAAAWLAVQVPREIGRWQLALAIQAWTRGQRPLAHQRLEMAMRWFPQHPALYLQQAEWHLEEGRRDEAFASLAQVREAAGEAPYWLMVQALFLQKAGAFDQAVPLWRIVEQRSQTSGIPPRSEALNGLAYAMALANVDLEEALALAQQALELQPDSPNILDTRGYILYRLHRYGEAARDLQRAAQYYDAQLAKLDEKLRAEHLVGYRPPPAALPQTIEEQFPLERSRWTDNLALFSQRTRQVAAVIHYHLALAFQAAGRQDGAELELQKLRELIGREPDATLF
jgi:tetratricopeptide (TPR) repeat protein